MPVVLLHGFAEDGAVWDQQLDALKKNYRLLIPDLYGSGRSSTLTEATSMEALAEDLLQILDHEAISQCVLIGHSMGGYVGLAFAQKHPERLLALGLFHSTAYPDSEEKKATRRKAIEFIRTNGSAAFIKQSTPNLFAAGTRDNRPGLINDSIERYSSFLPEALIAYYEAMIARPDRTEVLASLNCPILFVVGTYDQAVSPQHALEQSHLPSLSHIHILDNSAHMGMLEETDKSNLVLQSFLNFVTAL
ncbi:MAG: alpha/beta hydrolase [Bacteroidetes bacterium]|nr:alpha/beta hydrolase [Bacteroidota bacterium]